MKLHGTNAGIGFSEKLGVWAQSRTRVIRPDCDNQGFAAYVFQNKENYEKIIRSLAALFKVNLETHALVIFGEWAGGKIQKGVAINGLPNMFVMFDAFSFDISQEKPDDSGYVGTWYDVSTVCEACKNSLFPKELSFYNIYEFQTFSITVDFVNLTAARKVLEKITDDVEKECPVGRFFGKVRDTGVCTTGEGVVWRASVTVGERTRVFRFKVKGDEHATSATQVGASLELYKIDSFDDFIEKVVSDNRCKQGLSEVFGDTPMSDEWEKRNGEFLHWVVRDVKKEEMESFPFSEDYK